jgi:hypothetical protein
VIARGKALIANFSIDKRRGMWRHETLQLSQVEWRGFPLPFTHKHKYLSFIAPSITFYTLAISNIFIPKSRNTKESKSHICKYGETPHDHPD